MLGKPGRLIVVVILTAMLFSGMASSQQPSSGGGEHTQGQEAKTEQSEQTSTGDERGPKPTLPIVEVLPPPEAQKNPMDSAEAEKDSPADWRSPDGVIAIFSIVLAIVATLQLGVFAWQGWQLKNTVIAMREGAITQSKDMQASIAAAQTAADAARKSADTLVATERPHLFIVIKDFYFRDGAVNRSQAFMERFEQANSNWRVSYCFKNYGKTPAVIKETSHMLIHAIVLPKRAEYYRLDAVELESAIPSGGQTTPRKSIMGSMNPLTKDDYESVVRGQSSVWFYGRVVYNDLIGGGEHEHRFLWRYNGGSHGFRTHEYGDYNKNT